MRLHEIEDFGGIDADEDALRGECFQNHGAYLDAIAHRRFLIVGRKGSGKTAIFRRIITERRDDYFSFGHTFEDYPWAHHDLQAQSGVPEERRYIPSWKYLILLSLGKILLNQDQGIPWDDQSMESLGRLESFIVDSYGTRDPDVSQIFTPGKELKLKGSIRFPLGGVSLEKVRMSDLPAHFQELNRRVGEHTINALHPDHDYYICFDQLDLGFNPSEPTYKDRLIGLILAARQLSREAKAAGKRFSVIVFLRDDIYDGVHFEDKNKVTENNVSRVEWNTDGSLTLRRLMERRFGEVLLGAGAKDWDGVFNEDRDMPGRQTKYAHICDRTFLRPRDMIKFSNEILAAHKNRGGSLDDKFDNEDVIAARDAYSDYLLRELDDEIAKQVPAYKEYLEVIKSIGRMQFTQGQFDSAWRKRPGLSGKASADGLQELFEFSVIGYLRSGGRGGGSNYIWRYQDARARFSHDADTFRVHAGFKESLDLTFGESKDGN